MATTGLARASSPVRSGPAAAVQVRARRRPWLAIGSLLLMVTCGVLFVVLQQRADARVDVLVVAKPVAAGQVLAAGDMRVVRLAPGAGADVVLAADAALVVGHAAAVPLVPGALVARSQIGPADWPPAGQAVVAVPVKGGHLADGVTQGSRVLVVEVGRTGTGTSSSSGTAARAPVAAVVVAVRAGPDGTGTTTVSLLVPRQDAVTLAATSADVSVALAGE